MVSFNEIMSLVMPSLVALLFYSKLSGKSLSLFEAVTHFALFSLITNCVMYGILIYFLTLIPLFIQVYLHLNIL